MLSGRYMAHNQVSFANSKRLELVSEFLERLHEHHSKVRACDNELEHEKFNQIKDRIIADSEWIEPTYWSL